MGPSRTTPLARRRRRRRPQPVRVASSRPLRRVTRRPPSRLASVQQRSLRAVKRPPWKLVGLAGIAGVAATGVVVARKRRAHRDLPPDELREALHRRLAEVGSDPLPDAGPVGEHAPPAPPE